MNSVAVQLNMWMEENRLRSFKDWVFDENQKCSATKLAEAGFYYVGNEEEPDAVKCFLCSKMLDGWEAEDDPWLEHRKHNAKCSFAKAATPEGLLTVAQFMEMKKEQVEHVFKRHLADSRKADEDMLEEILEVLDDLVK